MWSNTYSCIILAGDDLLVPADKDHFVQMQMLSSLVVFQLFGICAFATTSSFSSSLSILYACNGPSTPTPDIQKKTDEIQFSYPFEWVLSRSVSFAAILMIILLSVFSLTKERIHRDPCNTSTETLFLGGSYASSAEFFVAIGVLTFLYCLAALLIYIFLDKLYRSRDSVPLAVSNNCGGAFRRK